MLGKQMLEAGRRQPDPLGKCVDGHTVVARLPQHGGDGRHTGIRRRRSGRESEGAPERRPVGLVAIGGHALRRFQECGLVGRGSYAQIGIDEADCHSRAATVDRAANPGVDDGDTDALDTLVRHQGEVVIKTERDDGPGTVMARHQAEPSAGDDGQVVALS